MKVNRQSYEGDIYNQLPQRDQYSDFDTQWSENNKAIVIETDDYRWQINSNYLISVFSDVWSASFILAVGYNTTNTILQNGIPVRNFVYENEYKYYVFNINTQADIYISLTALSGDPDLYVGLDPKVHKQNALWDSSGVKQKESIYISASDPNFRIGAYYISIFGYEYSEYSLSASTNNSFITLLDGVPMIYSIYINQWLYFDFWIQDESTTNVSCQLSPTTKAFRAEIYTLFTKEDQDQQFPSKTQNLNALKASDYDDLHEVLNFKLASQKNMGLGKWSLGVTAKQQGSFVIQCSQQSQFNFKLLRNAEMTKATIQAGEKHYYEIAVGESTNIYFEIEVCQENVIYSISNNFTTFKQRFNDQIVSNKKSQKLMDQNKALYIQVSSLNKDAEYWVRYTTFTTLSYVQDVIADGKGQISTTYDEKENQILVSWQPLIDQNGQPIPDVRYFVFLAQKQNKLNLYTSCGCQNAQDQDLLEKFDIVDKTNWKYSLKKQSMEVSYAINVVGHVWSNENIHSTESYIPTIIQIYSPHFYNKYPQTMIGFIVAIVAIFMIVVFILIKKLRKMRARLKYEMQDVRNLASVVSEEIRAPNEEAIKEKYTQLTVFSSGEGS